MDKAKNIKIDACAKELNEKISILKILLENYDDGHRKSFFCTALNLLELQDVKSAMVKIDLEARQCQGIKDRATIASKIFQTIAEKQGISLKLRKKTKE